MQKGDVIRINYIGRLESGEIFDITYEDVAKKEGVYSQRIKYGPVTIIVGAGFVIPGIDNALKEMNVGEKKSIAVEPKDAFGERDAKLVKVVPQKAFKDQKVEPQQGMVVDFSGVKGRIQSVSAGRVRVDFNNPLAGKTLKYELEIKEKIEDPIEKVSGIFEFFGFYNANVLIENKEAVVKAAIPQQLKQRLSSVIIENIPEVEKVTYQESYEKKENK
jgi:FKBP-type peptidyl-prolyl cis-trans isomerase 2